MRNLVRTSLVLGTLMSASGALSVVIVGCGGDDTAIVGGGDATPDQTTDALGGDASTDHSVPRDGGSDVVNDLGSGGDGEAPFDAQALYAFPNAVNTAWCKRLADCCDGADASAFQLNECVATGLGVGGWLNVSIANVHSGHIDYFPTAAANCLSDIGSINCGTLTSTAIEQQISTCGQAMVGTLGVGQSGCTSAWDCAPPAYCDNFEADGGMADGGTCKALIPAGSTCQDVTFGTDCSEVGNGHPSRYCAPVDGGANACESEFEAGTSCGAYYQCQTQICDNTTSQCQSTTIFSDPGDASVVCAFYNTPVDGG